MHKGIMYHHSVIEYSTKNCSNVEFSVYITHKSINTSYRMFVISTNCPLKQANTLSELQIWYYIIY